MTEERIITAAIITTGEKNDGKQLQTLIEKSKAAGMEVKTVIGDMAYSEKDNITYTKDNEIELVAKLNPPLRKVTARKKTNSNSIKMRACMCARPAIWRSGKHGKEKKGLEKTKRIRTTLM